MATNLFIHLGENGHLSTFLFGEGVATDLDGKQSTRSCLKAWQPIYPLIFEGMATNLPMHVGEDGHLYIFSFGGDSHLFIFYLEGEGH